MDKITLIALSLMDREVKELDMLKLQRQIAVAKTAIMGALKDNKEGLEYSYPSFFFESAFPIAKVVNSLDNEKREWSWFFKIQLRIRDKLDKTLFNSFCRKLETIMNENLKKENQKLLDHGSDVVFTSIELLDWTTEISSVQQTKLM